MTLSASGGPWSLTGIDVKQFHSRSFQNQPIIVKNEHSKSFPLPTVGSRFCHAFFQGLWYSTKRNKTKQLVIDETKRNETIGNRRNETIFDLRKKW